MKRAQFSYNYEKLVKDLKKARLARGMTQAALADLLGLTKPSISRMERDQQRLDPVDLMFLCWFFDLDPYQYLKVPDSVKKTAAMFDLAKLQTKAGAA